MSNVEEQPQSERVLTERELANLRWLVADGTALFFEDFIGFIVMRITQDTPAPGEFMPDNLSKTLRSVGSLAADWAFGIRQATIAEQWPETTVRPGLVYAEFEKWLEDEQTPEIAMDGQTLTVKQYLDQTVLSAGTLTQT